MKNETFQAIMVILLAIGILAIAGVFIYQALITE
jgi:hypothetical protein